MAEKISPEDMLRVENIYLKSKVLDQQLELLKSKLMENERDRQSVVAAKKELQTEFLKKYNLVLGGADQVSPDGTIVRTKLVPSAPAPEPSDPPAEQASANHMAS